MNVAKGPRYRQLPLWRDASQFLLEVEQAVRRFPRYHKYTLGSELRRQAMQICRLVARAAQCAETAQRERLVESLVWQVEDAKMSVQLAKELQAFCSPPVRTGAGTGRMVLGKQSGGWWKRARSAAQGASRVGAS